MGKERKISYFKNCRAKTPEVVTIEAALYWIKNGSSKELIFKIRAANDQPTKDLYKQKLPAVTFGGLLEDRSTLLEASGFACLDFDKVDNIEQLSQGLRDSPFIYSFWVSPSGNGIKALVKIPVVESKVEYKLYYKSILRHFKELQPDIATKDLNRLCFESYDPYLYLNEGSKIFEKKLKFKHKAKAEIVPNSNLPEGKIVDRLIQWWVKKYSFANGCRNNSLFVLACSFSNFGVSKSTTEDIFQSFEDIDFPYTEIQTLINSAYKKADFNSKSFPL